MASSHAHNALEILEGQNALTREGKRANHRCIDVLPDFLLCGFEEALPDGITGVPEGDTDSIVWPLFLDFGKDTAGLFVRVCGYWEGISLSTAKNK